MAYPPQSGNQNTSGNVPPPPPSPDQQVGVRSMESDLESIRQTGGEAPAPQIINAPELSGQKQEMSVGPQEVPPAPPAPPSPAPFGAGPVSQQPQPSAPPQFNQSTGPDVSQDFDQQPPKKKMSVKVILLTILIFVLAVGVGYGVYYLVSSLGKTPQVDLTVPAENSGFPVALPEQEPVATSTQQEVEEEIPSFTHVSLLSSPDVSGQVVLSEFSSAELKLALGALSAQGGGLVSGAILDIAMVDASSSPVASDQLLSILLPSLSVSAPSLFDKDVTAWLYGDKVGGSKFGVILKLSDQTTIEQASSKLRSVVEANPQELTNLFVSSLTVPANAKFNDGQVAGVPVRFMSFDAKTGNVFEYGFVSIGQGVYVVMGTSYNQMVDIINRLVPTQTQ